MFHPRPTRTHLKKDLVEEWNSPHGTQPWGPGLEHPHVSAWKMMNNCKWAIVGMLHLGVFSAVYINIRSRNQFIVTSIWSVVLRWCFCHTFLVSTFLPSFLGYYRVTILNFRYWFYITYYIHLYRSIHIYRSYPSISDIGFRTSG